MVSGRVERGNTQGEGSPDQHETAFGEVGVVSVPLKATSSDLNRVSKKGHHQGGGRPQDVKNPGSGVAKEVGTERVGVRGGGEGRKTLSRSNLSWKVHLGRPASTLSKV